jgi:hypothetical protein
MSPYLEVQTVLVSCFRPHNTADYTLCRLWFTWTAVLLIFNPTLISVFDAFPRQEPSVRRVREIDDEKLATP